MPTDSIIPAQRFDLNETLLDQLRSIYLDSFPPSERDDFQNVVARIVDGSRWLSTVEQAGELLSFAIVVPLADTHVHYLEYIATAEKARGKGVGSVLLKFVCAHLRSLGHITGLLLEVESERAGPEEERLLRRRRVEFYKRHGAVPVDAAPAYRAPNMAGEGAIPFRLMWIPVEIPATPLSGELLRQCIVSIYRQSYGRPGDDRLLQNVLAELTG